MVGDRFWDPDIAPRSAIAWRAMQHYLVGNEPAGWVALKEAARKNSELKGETCRTLVREAVKAGLIEKVGKRYRLTEKGRAT